MLSIERYLLSWILGASGLGALVMVLAVYVVTLDEMNEVYDADLKHIAEALGSYHPIDQKPMADPDRPLPERSDPPTPEEIVTILWTADGRRVYSSDPRVAIPFMTHEALTQVRLANEEWIVYTDVSRSGVAQAAQRVAARRETAAESASRIFPAVVGFGLAVGALLVLALRRGMRPLDVAARDIAARSATSLVPMEVSGFPHELTPLVRSINGLLERLSDAIGAQRRFLADAAHELRTPVTALRLQLQLLRRSVDDASKHEAMQELESGIDRSQHLIERLLQVARSESGAEASSPEWLDLSDLVREVVATLSPKAEQRGVDLGANATRRLDVRGERHELGVLLINLVENALRYTPAGGVVDVEACVLDDRPVLRVIDDGPGIAEAERERVFDRFYRGADAHALAREPGGSGLGLSIVRAIADRHDAAVSLHTPRTGRGLEVRVVFPMVQPPSAASSDAAPQRRVSATAGSDASTRHGSPSGSV
jgi:two-component system, OmpR family, sensor kinase